MSPRPLRFRRFIFRLLRILAGVYLGVIVIMLIFQNRFIYFPDTDVSATPAAVGLSFEPVAFAADDGVALTGWFVPAEDTRATVLFCHGNAGNISHRLNTLTAFHRLGLDVFIFDYRGYGESAGKPSEAGLYRDADAAWRWLTKVRRVAPDRIIIVGRSLGGAVAAHLARERSPRALALESAFTSMADLGAHIYPWLPVRWILRSQFDTAEAISELTCPVLIVHSPDDRIVPYRFGRKLFEGAPEPKTFLEIAGGHNDGFETWGEIYADGWQKFLDTLSSQTMQDGRAASK